LYFRKKQQQKNSHHEVSAREAKYQRPRETKQRCKYLAIAVLE
jgi:hypothetical protein